MTGKIERSICVYILGDLLHNGLLNHVKTKLHPPQVHNTTRETLRTIHAARYLKQHSSLYTMSAGSSTPQKTSYIPHDEDLKKYQHVYIGRGDGLGGLPRIIRTSWLRLANCHVTEPPMYGTIMKEKNEDNCYQVYVTHILEADSVRQFPFPFWASDAGGYDTLSYLAISGFSPSCC